MGSFVRYECEIRLKISLSKSNYFGCGGRVNSVGGYLVYLTAVASKKCKKSKKNFAQNLFALSRFVNILSPLPENNFCRLYINMPIMGIYYI